MSGPRLIAALLLVGIAALLVAGGVIAVLRASGGG